MQEEGTGLEARGFRSAVEAREGGVWSAGALLGLPGSGQTPTIPHNLAKVRGGAKGWEKLGCPL